MDVVSLQRCARYEDCRSAIGQALEESGLLPRLVGRRVLLKPNLMKGAPPEHGECTHPAFVGALTAILVEAGGEVLVGDSSGLLGFTSEVLEASGVDRAVRHAGGSTINLDAGPFERLEGVGERGLSFWIPRALLQVDAIVQVPKLKSHTFTTLSCAVKNLVGVLPGATKCDLHVRLPRADLFGHGVIDLMCALEEIGVALEGAVVDGIWALAGKGSRGGAVLRRPGVVVAGASLTAVDYVCAAALGVDPLIVSTIRAAATRGLGPATLAEVDLRGRSGLSAAASFELPAPGAKERSVALHLLHYALRGRAIQIIHDSSRCAGHLECVRACPTGCLTADLGRPAMGEGCIRCYACHARCPEGAIGLRVPRLVRRMIAARFDGIDVQKLS